MLCSSLSKADDFIAPSLIIFGLPKLLKTDSAASRCWLAEWMPICSVLLIPAPLAVLLTRVLVVIRSLIDSAVGVADILEDRELSRCSAIGAKKTAEL
jgi:hypothetical protein